MRITIHIEQLISEGHKQNLRLRTDGTSLKEVLANTTADFTSTHMRTVRGGLVTKFDRFIMFYVIKYLEKRGFSLDREYLPTNVHPGVISENS